MHSKITKKKNLKIIVHKHVFFDIDIICIFTIVYDQNILMLEYLNLRQSMYCVVLYIVDVRKCLINIWIAMLDYLYIVFLKYDLPL